MKADVIFVHLEMKTDVKTPPMIDSGDFVVPGVPSSSSQTVDLNQYFGT